MIRFVLWLCLLIILIKNPTALYRMMGTWYKFLYAFAVCAVVADYLLVTMRRPQAARVDGVLGIVGYGVFFVASVVVVLVDALFAAGLDLLLTVQFVVNLGQFFLVLHLVRRLMTPSRLLNLMYRTAVVLGALTLAMWSFNLAGWFPFPAFRAWEAADTPDGLLFYPPFGFASWPLPRADEYYRSFSIFTEPAYVPFFFVPFCVYSVYRFRATGRWRHVLACAIVGTAAATSASVAGLAVAVLTGVAVSGYRSLRRPLAMRYWFLAAAGVVVAAMVATMLMNAGNNPDNAYLYNRYQSIKNRLHQWEVALAYTSRHVVGEGIGRTTSVDVYRDEANVVATYDKFTNILELVYYLGLIYALPLAGLLFVTLRHIFRGLEDRDRETRTFAIMLLYMLFYNAADQVFFSGYFLMMLAAFYLRRSSALRERAGALLPVGARGLVAARAVS